MTWVLSAHPEVEDDLIEVTDYYKAIDTDLADRFVKESESAVAFVEQYPSAGHVLHTKYRRVTLARFPYLVCYRLKGDTIRVLAVVHDRRDPKWVRRRLAGRS